MRIEPASRLSGTLVPPPDKSISHRAGLLAAMCERPVAVRRYLRSADTGSTLAAIRALGAAVEERAPADDAIELRIRGVGLRGARPGSEIDAGNAGTLMRLLPGWLAGQSKGEWTLDGDESLRARPVDRIVAPLAQMGARIRCRDGRLPPLEVQGSALEGIRYQLPVASAQVKSCLLLAALLANGKTTIVERTPSRDHTERMLAAAGAPLEVERHNGAADLKLEGVEEIELDDIIVPGDLSSAAFFAVAATVTPRSKVLLRDVGVNPTRKGLLTVMERMGAQIEILDRRFVTAEPVAHLAVRHAELRGTTVRPEEVPRMIDELPLIALLGAFAEGRTTVEGAQELRHKESDRITSVVEGLRALGAEIEATADGFTVEGGGALRGGTLDSAGDHRVAMLGAAAGVASKEGVEVRGFEAVSISYPRFAADLASVTR